MKTTLSMFLYELKKVCPRLNVDQLKHYSELFSDIRNGDLDEALAIYQAALSEVTDFWQLQVLAWAAPHFFEVYFYNVNEGTVDVNLIAVSTMTLDIGDLDE